jgi:hypothetical protein
MKIRSGSPGVRLGEDAYANEKDRVLGLSKIADDSTFKVSLRDSVDLGLISQIEASEIESFRRGYKTSILKPTLTRIPGSTSDGVGPGIIDSTGAITLDKGREAYLSKTKEDTRSDTKKFLDWLDCSTAKGWGPIPDSAARSACYARNAVLGTAPITGVAWLKVLALSAGAYLVIDLEKRAVPLWARLRSTPRGRS